jgi:hypothetical protein
MKIFYGYKSPIDIRITIFLFCLAIFLNFNHNWIVSGENTNRNFQYSAWQTLTGESNLFSKVRSKDVFISASQNDAFETNAGTFYFNTGIRLAYLFNTSLVYPNIANCSSTANCKLENVRTRVMMTLPNLTRGSFIPKKRDSSRVDDWVGTNLKPGALDSNTIWAFDSFLLSTNTYFVYLVPFIEGTEGANVDFKKIRVMTITNGNVEEFGPSVGNICLLKESSSYGTNGNLMTYWKLSEDAVDPSGTPIKSPNSLDLRELQAGTCRIAL